jgi:hypothetical protein
MLALQILAAVIFFGLILLAVLAFIEPGPLDRRSRDRQGQSPVARRAPAPESQETTNTPPSQ